MLLLSDTGFKPFRSVTSKCLSSDTFLRNPAVYSVATCYGVNSFFGSQLEAAQQIVKLAAFDINATHLLLRDKDRM